MCVHNNRGRIRMFPALTSCTTIDWFGEWPEEALLEVAEKYLENVHLGEVRKVREAPDQEEGKALDLRQSMADMFVVCHCSVVSMSERMLVERSRYNYVTPTNYLELVAGYKK